MSSSTLDQETSRGIAALLDMLIPADPARGLPPGSAVGFTTDDTFREALKGLNETCQSKFKKNFADLSSEERQTIVTAMSRVQKTAFTRLAKNLAEFYYLQPQVSHAIGAPEEPPFPEGYRVEEGDLTLVEPVYLRDKIFRDV